LRGSALRIHAFESLFCLRESLVSACLIHDTDLKEAAEIRIVSLRE
jgi:hypothetical protein